MGVSILDKSVTRGQLQILAKQAVTTHQVAGKLVNVRLVLDVSGSTEFPQSRFYSGGIMDALATNVSYVCQELDDDGNMPVYWFNDRVGRFSDDMTPQNMDDYIATHFTRRVLGGGTNYAPFVDAVVRDAIAEHQVGRCELVCVFTDGENSDHREAEAALVRASSYPIFWQFCGMWGDGGEPGFEFLHRLDTMTGRLIDNAGFSPFGVKEMTHEELMDELLHEFREYPDKAEAAGLLNWDGGSKRGGGLGGWFRRG